MPNQDDVSSALDPDARIDLAKQGENITESVDSEDFDVAGFIEEFKSDVIDDSLKDEDFVVGNQELHMLGRTIAMIGSYDRHPVHIDIRPQMMGPNDDNYRVSVTHAELTPDGPGQITPSESTTIMERAVELFEARLEGHGTIVEIDRETCKIQADVELVDGNLPPKVKGPIDRDRRLAIVDISPPVGVDDGETINITIDVRHDLAPLKD